jgi:hypothetical protein
MYYHFHLFPSISSISIYFLCYLCTKFYKKIASLAQLVEQLIRNEQVVGSSPIGGSIPFQLSFKQRTEKPARLISAPL